MNSTIDSALHKVMNKAKEIGPERDEAEPLFVVIDTTVPALRLDTRPAVGSTRRPIRVPRAVVALTAALVVAGCGGHQSKSAAFQACVKERLPGGKVERTTSSTVEGVTSVAYFQHGSAAVELTIFPTVSAARDGEAAEARIGDAHDRRIANVLYSGGGLRVRAAVASCLR